MIYNLREYLKYGENEKINLQNIKTFEILMAEYNKNKIEYDRKTELNNSLKDEMKYLDEKIYKLQSARNIHLIQIKPNQNQNSPSKLTLHNKFVFCPKCGTKIQKTEKDSKTNSKIGGAVAGAILGSKVGIAMGPLGAIAGTVPGAILGGVFGNSIGNKLNHINCPQCNTSFRCPD